MLLGLVVLPGFAADDVKPDAKKDVDKPSDAKKDVDKPTDPKTDPKKDVDKPTDPKKDTDKPDAKKDKERKAGVLDGEVVSYDEAKKSLKMRVNYVVPKFNQNEANALAQAQADYQRAIAKGDRNGAANAQRAIAEHQAKVTTPERKSTDLTLDLLDNASIRAHDPPLQFDDKGKPKKYTAKELKELKGDSKEPGYPADAADLKSGVLVEVTLVEDKDAAKSKPTPKGKDKETDPDLLKDHLPKAKAIMIMGEKKK
jgi:hypothetical protein